MKKKLIGLVVALVLVALCVTSLVACGDSEFKVGLICLHDNNSTYDKNFIEAMYRAVDNLGLKRSQLELVTGIPEDSECYETASDLAATCDIVFANSFGHEDYMIQAAQENPDVIFSHATGTKAHTENLPNYYNAFASIYEGRYLAGIAAGMKLNQMISNGTITAEEAIIGYVGAYNYAEVISGYTSFYLGARSVCPSATMKVRYTFSWFDFNKEKEAANSLVGTDDCVLISQHADSYGAPQACEQLSVPNVSYNGSTANECPNTYLVSSKIDWTPYYEMMIKAAMEGREVTEKDYTGTLETGSVKLDDLGTCAAPGTAEAINTAKQGLIDGTLKVFDTSKFTVGGSKLTTYLADVDSDAKFTGDTEAVINGIFEESLHRSAPYFNIIIDGITELNAPQY